MKQIRLDAAKTLSRRRVFNKIEILLNYSDTVYCTFQTSHILRLNFVFFDQAELTQSLQQLSEKAKSATEVMQRLKSSSERVQVSSSRL